MTTDYKTLIQSATDRAATKHVLQLQFSDAPFEPSTSFFNGSFEGYKAGAALPNKLLLKAAEVIQEEIDLGYDQCGHLNNLLNEIRAVLEGEKNDMG